MGGGGAGEGVVKPYLTYMSNNVMQKYKVQ